jgi:hypothetical protein
MQEDTRTVDERALRDVVPIALWTLIWLATLAVARFGPDWWGSQPVVSWIAVGVNIAAGAAWVIAHARWLRKVDELQRKILVESMAVALGVGLVGGFAYAAAHSAGLITLDAGVGLLATLMALVYAFASIVGHVRYR